MSEGERREKGEGDGRAEREGDRERERVRERRDQCTFFSSVGNSPAPTRVVYALTTP
jgi:hypothetical protein